jgi:hypothetical protein
MFRIYLRMSTDFGGVIQAVVQVQAGLVLHQGYVPEKCRINRTQNSHLKQYCQGVRELTTSSYTVFNYTTKG